MVDAEEIPQLREVLARECRRLHDLLVRGTLIGWPDVPIHLIRDLAATRAQVEHTQAQLRQHGVAVTDCTGELHTLMPLGLMVTEPVLKEAEELWTSNRYDEAVSVLRAMYVTKQQDHMFTERYLQYWYMLGIRAVILDQLPVAYRAVQEVVHFDAGYKHASELLYELERQRRGEPRPVVSANDVPAPRLPRVEARASVPHKGRHGWFSALALHRSVLIAGTAALITVLLLTALVRWMRLPLGPGAVPSASVTTVASVIAAAPLPATSTLELEDSGSVATTLATARPTAALAATQPLTPTARLTAAATALSATPVECGTRRVDVPALHVRDGPLGASLHKVYQGTQLTLICETQTVNGRQWVKIRVTADPTIVGWIRADYLQQP
jgi:GW (Gly-Tryp) dipeptide domain